MISISLAIIAKGLISSENIMQSSTGSSVEAIKIQLSSFEAHMGVDGGCCNFSRKLYARGYAHITPMC